MVIEIEHKNKILNIKLDKGTASCSNFLFCIPALTLASYFSVLLPLYTRTHASRPKASQKTRNGLEPLLFVVRWSKKKAH